MNLYCCQLDLAWENKQANFTKAHSLLSGAKPERGSLVLLPELFATGFTMNTAPLAEKPGGETERFLAELARELGVFVLGGVLGAAAKGRGRNLSVVFSPEGREIARYAKIQTFTIGGETEAYEAGNEPVIFDWAGIAVAPFICYDLRFPEHFRLATRRGAQLLTVIASWPVARIEHWVALLRARAIENQAYVAGCNRCGKDPKLNYNGRSMIISPKGDVLVDAEDGEKIIRADIDLATLQAYRKELPFLADIR